MINIKICLNKLRMPSPRKATQGTCILKRVQSWIDDLEDRDDKIQKIAWKKLKTLYKKLIEGSYDTDRKEELLSMLTPVIRQSKQYDNEGVAESSEYLPEDMK